MNDNTSIRLELESVKKNITEISKDLKILINKTNFLVNQTLLNESLRSKQHACLPQPANSLEELEQLLETPKLVSCFSQFCELLINHFYFSQ